MKLNNHWIITRYINEIRREDFAKFIGPVVSRREEKYVNT